MLSKTFPLYRASQALLERKYQQNGFDFCVYFINMWHPPLQIPSAAAKCSFWSLKNLLSELLFNPFNGSRSHLAERALCCDASLKNVRNTQDAPWFFQDKKFLSAGSLPGSRGQRLIDAGIWPVCGRPLAGRYVTFLTWSSEGSDDFIIKSMTREFHRYVH